MNYNQMMHKNLQLLAQFWGLRLQTPPRVAPLDPAGDFRSPDPDSDSDLLNILARRLKINNTNSTNNTTQQYKKIQFNAMQCHAVSTMDIAGSRAGTPLLLHYTPSLTVFWIKAWNYSCD